MKQLIKFGTIGTIGFIVDASILLLAVEILMFSIEISRAISFLVAVFVTWLLNRIFTFSNNSLFSIKKEYILYLIIQTFGALLNYLIFLILIYNFEIMEQYLLIPLSLASLIIMFFNFFITKRVIYN